MAWLPKRSGRGQESRSTIKMSNHDEFNPDKIAAGIIEAGHEFLRQEIRKALEQAIEYGYIKGMEESAKIADSHAIEHKKRDIDAQNEGRFNIASDEWSRSEEAKMIANIITLRIKSLAK